jgi:ketol-acid reductoisomerase
MARIDFGGVMEEVVTADEFTLERAREVLEKETVAVLGYGIQGPGQALNMRDNGINVIVGQREGGRSWQRALDDGFVAGKTLFPLEEAADRGTIVQFLVSDAGQVAAVAQGQGVPQRGRCALFFARLFHRLQGARRV